MEQNDFLKRISDLAQRCERNGYVTSSLFLTPAETYLLENTKLDLGDTSLLLSGGIEGCERRVAFFLPYYQDAENFDVSDTIKAIRIKAFFGSPGHRDYLGAILGLGIERDRIGDILLFDDYAYVFCLSTVASAITQNLDKVGRTSVKAEIIALSDVPVPERRVKNISFTVKSLRLDAVTGDMFGISRTTAAELIRIGAVSLNYSVCEKPDAPVKEGDILSVRGKGKGRISEIGGRSKKDRLFVSAEIYL